MTSQLPGHLERASAMFQEFLIVLFVCGVPAVLVFHGWKRGEPIDRLELLRDCIGVAVVSFIAIAISRTTVGAIIAIPVWFGSAVWMLRSLGKRLKDARVPAWAVWVIGCTGFTGVPYLLGLFLPSRMLKEPKRIDSAEPPAISKSQPTIEPVMKHSYYSVHIAEGEETSDGYVRMCHGTTYTIRLENEGRKRCDAKVEIDGHPVGTWRIGSQSFILLERPAHETGRFTFFKAGSIEGEKAAIIRSENTGLISVTFVPEKLDRSHGLSAAPLSEESEEDGAGGTGLTGHSAQKFTEAEPIDLDVSMAFTIHLRLVAKPEKIRPLMPRSTPVPPPLEV